MTIFVFSGNFSYSQNPIVKGGGMSDPHVRIFNDTIFLYCGHDSSATDNTWIMKDWRIFYSTDLINWHLSGEISPKDNYMTHNSTDCWAGDAATRNGKYYFYFSDRKRGIGVMVSESPHGKFEDALNRPLVAPMHDPTILIDDDSERTPYIVYGDKAGGGFHIAPLNSDMISVKKQPVPIEIIGEEWENAPIWMDKTYIFKHNGTYYLSWGRDYATSNSVYGPYICRGSVGFGHNLSEYAHGSFFWWKGQFYHIWCYYLKLGYKYRETIISYCHFDNDGNIVTDTEFLDKYFANGVGQYNASWDRIEAEWYYEISPNIHKKGYRKDGFVLTNIKDGEWIKFSNVNFDKIYKNFNLRMKLPKCGGSVEIRKGSLSGEIIGKAKFSAINKPNIFKTIKGELKNNREITDIYLKFNVKCKLSITLDWIKFND